VRLLVRDPKKMERIYAPTATRIDEFVVGDVTDPACVGDLLDGCDALVHTAALVSLEAARADEVRRTNEDSVRYAIGGAVERGLDRIVYVSSAGALFVPGGPPLTGQSPIGASANAYGESKASGELYVRDLQRAGAPILTTFPTAAIGPDDPGLTDPNRAVSFFVRYGAILTSSGYQPIDVRDLACLHVALVESDQSQGRYVAAGPYLPWSSLYASVERVTGRRLPHYRIPGKVLRGIGRVGDILRRPVPVTLPIPITREAIRDLDETLADTYRWMHAAGHVNARQIGRLAPTP